MRTASIGSNQRRQINERQELFFRWGIRRQRRLRRSIVVPAYAGNGSDARAQARQAQLHPMMTNQYPDVNGGAAAPFHAAEAQVVPGFGAAQAYVAARPY